MKKILYIIFIIIGIVFFVKNTFGGYSIPVSGNNPIEKVSTTIASSSSIVETINSNGFKLLSILKLIGEGLMLIFIVYAGAQMIWSMGENEDTLAKAKRQLWYAIIAMLFINIPGTLYSAFSGTNKHGKIGEQISNGVYKAHYGDWNIFVNIFDFGYTFGDKVIGFLEVIIIVLGIIVIIYEALKLITSRGREEVVKEAKTKIVYSALALTFVGIIQSWKAFAFNLRVSDATNIFKNLSNLALFYAAPVAFFFLTIAAYYYITANGNDDRIKKAKNIITNVIIATIILLASYSILVDLADL